MLCEEPLPSEEEFQRQTQYIGWQGANKVVGNVGEKIFRAAQKGEGSPESRALVFSWHPEARDSAPWYDVFTTNPPGDCKNGWFVRDEIKAALRELYWPDENRGKKPGTVVLGMEYSLEDLGRASSGAQLQRIATPVDQLFVDLFTEENSDAFGCKDVFRDDGVFVYTGERQTRYTELEGVNLAVRDSARDGKQLRLFEPTKEGKARFLGYAVYLSHHIEERPDSTGELRSAILFELEVSALGSFSTHAGVSAGVGSLSAPDLSAVATLADLRVAALLPSPSGSTPKQRRAFVYYRSNAVKKYVLMRAKGKCEGCEKSAPFVNRRQEPFLDPHHTTRLADGGPDHPAHVIALCPNCHREVHHGADGDKLNAKLVVWLQTKEHV